MSDPRFARAIRAVCQEDVRQLTIRAAQPLISGGGPQTVMEWAFVMAVLWPDKRLVAA